MILDLLFSKRRVILDLLFSKRRVILDLLFSKRRVILGLLFSEPVLYHKAIKGASSDVSSSKGIQPGGDDGCGHWSGSSLLLTWSLVLAMCAYLSTDVYTHTCQCENELNGSTFVHQMRCTKTDVPVPSNSLTDACKHVHM